MIKCKDVIRIKLPYPNSKSKLAFSSHMYICFEKSNLSSSFLKCQSLKPYMIQKNIILNYIDEEPNINRNPFFKNTRIDCDKIFYMKGLKYDISLKTDRRPNICEDLYLELKSKLASNRYMKIRVNEEEVIQLNHLITKY